MKSSIARLAKQAAKPPGRRPFDLKARMPQSSYYQGARPGASLERARRQYLLPNIITGICIFGFVIGVYAFTIKSVSQDEFEDVPIPDGPAPAAAAPHASNNLSAGPVPASR